MSKTGGVLGSVLSASGQHEAYLLTGRAGSFLYMAPEVVMCQPYNEKVPHICVCKQCVHPMYDRMYSSYSQQASVQASIFSLPNTGQAKL